MRRKAALERRRGAQLWLPFEVPPAPTPPRFAAPSNDNERLLNAQADIKAGVAQGWRDMYRLGVSVALRMLGDLSRRYPAIKAMSSAELEERAHDAVVYILEGYLSDERFVITKSFTSYLWLRVRAAVLNHSKADELVTFVDDETLARFIEDGQQ